MTHTKEDTQRIIDRANTLINCLHVCTNEDDLDSNVSCELCEYKGVGVYCTNSLMFDTMRMMERAVELLGEVVSDE